MLEYVVRRLAYGVVTLLALSFVVFMLVQMSGGGPLDRLKLNPRMLPVIAQLTEEWGLDRPLLVQYGVWLRNFVTPAEVQATEGVIVIAGRVGLRSLTPVFSVLAAAGLTFCFSLVKTSRSWWPTFRGIATFLTWIGALWFAKSRIVFSLVWGDSFRGDGAVWDTIFGAAGATLRLGVTAMLLALLIGVPLGIFQALRQYSFLDQTGTSFSFIAFSTPIFIIALGLQLGLGHYLQQWTGVKLFNVIGMTDPSYDDLGRLAQIGDAFRHLALPALSIALISVAIYARFQRAAMLEVLKSDYLRTAKAKGVPRRRVILKHGLRNALIPVVTLVSLDIAGVIGGAIITESIFGWPGVGRLYINAIQGVDYPMIMAVVMIIGAGIVIMNIVADILYGVLDPRVRND